MTETVFFQTLLVIANGLLVGVGCLQYLTLDKTDRTLRATFEASNAAQRAYIVSNELLIVPNKGQDGRVQSWTVSPVIENAGATSAQGGMFTAGISRWRGVDFPGTPDPPEEPPAGARLEQRQARAIAISPKDRVSTAIVPFHLPVATFKESLRQRLFIVGDIGYDDVFGGPHVTRFCHILWNDRDDADAERLTFSRCGGRANCADKQCDGQK